MSLIEIQVDRIVGPTHHFGGLGVGNVASQQNEGQVSNPAAAALQGLAKMNLVSQLGAPQMVLPPQPRPDLHLLRRHGFGGTNGEVLSECFGQAPRLLSAATSCSAMWTANAATVSPAVDNRLQKLTLSVANLNGSLHRAIEPEQTLADLRSCFPAARVIPALPGGSAMRDEGAANHMRLGTENESQGIHIFVYGDRHPESQNFWPRQTLETCQSIARCHGLPTANTFFIKQHPRAIDAGAFHNDVVAASHHDLLIFHEQAFYQADDVLDQICERYKDLTTRELSLIQVSSQELPIERAVATYLFNSQIVSDDSNQPIVLCPTHVREDSQAKRIVEGWCEKRIFAEVKFVDLGQSMSGGGGPACLRLRVPVTNEQFERTNQSNRFSQRLYDQLVAAIEKHYPKELRLRDLANIEFVRQTTEATQVVTQMLKQPD